LYSFSNDRPVRHFYHSASYRSNELPGFHAIDFAGDENFDAFINFESVEKLIILYIDEENRRNSRYENSVLESLQSAHSTIRPIFTSVVTHINKKLAFVLMPFTEKWSDRLYRLIQEELKELGIQCLRADNFTGEIVIEDVWVGINQAAFIIADMTNKNPNVMYEMGIVHTVGKPAILITQHLKGIPFDLTHMRHYGYEDNIDGFELLKTQLAKAVKGIYNKYYPGILA
jgi:hypothetical protein